MAPGNRLVVTNAPTHFLKERIIKSHFSKFGSITSVIVNQDKRNCTVTFQKSDQAELALKNGSQWKHFKLEIESVPGSVSSATTSKFDPGYDIESELNWFAEEDFTPPGHSDPFSESREKLEQKRNCNSPKRTDDSSGSLKKVIVQPTEDTKKPTDNKQETKSRGNENEFLGEELLNKVALTMIDRLALLEERDKLLRIRLNRDSNIKTAVAIKGLCPDMCPEKERILRDVRGIVASYESVDGTNIKMDHSKAVKDYSRSSADQEEPLAHELRPEPVLTMTMDYLITQIMNKIDTGEEDNLGNVYDFCWYRLRSIRKDIIQQQLCDINIVEIVEKCARFHICCFDRYWGTQKSIFDEKMNAETLKNCLQSLMHMYEDLRRQGTECPNEAEFRAYLILLKLNSGFLLSEYQQYPSELRNSPQVKDAVLIHTAYSNNMYWAYFTLMKKTTYLNCCLLQRFLAHMRTKALEIIVRAHCPPNKISRLPVSFITHTLKFDSRQDCIRFCESFGLVLADDSYSFIVSRNDFFFPDSLFIISTPSALVVRKRVSVLKAVVGVRSKLPVYIPHEIHTSFNKNGTLKPGALDATDQEEKLYRDIVERKLILKRGTLSLPKPSAVPEEPEIIETPPPSPKASVEPASTPQVVEPPLEDVSSDEENDNYLQEGVIEGAILISEEPAVEEGGTSFIEQLSESDSVISSSSEEESENETDSFDIPQSSSNLNCESPKDKSPLELSCSSFTKFIFKPPTALNIKQSPIIDTPKPKPPSSPLVSIPTKRRKITSPVTAPWNFPQISPWKPEKCVPKKESKISMNLKDKNIQENISLMKLKKIKSPEKMKKTSVRKYAMIWRAKAEKLKKVSDKSLRDYLFYWGTSNQCIVPRNGFRNRFFQKKKTGLVVLSILHGNIIDRIDPSTGKIGTLLSDTLARVAVNFAKKQGNVSQPYPVFWKFVFALPPPLKGNFTFPDKLKKWCTTAFYTDSTAKLGEAQYRLSSLEVPVFISANVLLGSKSFEEQCSNVSAVVVIRAHGWETKEETQQRCDKLISVTDNKFPLAILTLGEKFESCSQLRYLNRLTYFHETLWKDNDTLVATLLSLAENTFFQCLKVDSLRSVITVNSEKLFDALHEDKFINDGLNYVLCEPNNVIKFYNELIHKIGSEILACYEANLYGTASEFEHYVKKKHLNIVEFPEHYKDLNFRDIFKKHLRKAYLPEIKWPFTNSKELLTVFKNYCHNIDCDRIFSKLIRFVNPPDSTDYENPLSNHLELVPWLRIVEDLVKEILKLDNFQFNVVYRPNKFTEHHDSHWWMSSDVVINALTESCTSFQLE